MNMPKGVVKLVCVMSNVRGAIPSRLTKTLADRLVERGTHKFISKKKYDKVMKDLGYK